MLAEPNLVAMSGETASFLAGGEIPVIAPQAGTLFGAFSVTYKPYGISLSFTPTIVGDRIDLKVAPEVSQVSTVGALNVPLTPTTTSPFRRSARASASTTVELGSGQSFAIAGLLMRLSQDDREVPLAGRHSGARHAVQVGRLSALGDRAGDHHHALPGRADQWPAADAAHRPRAADRYRPAGHAALQPSDAAAPLGGRPRDDRLPAPPPASHWSRGNHAIRPPRSPACRARLGGLCATRSASRPPSTPATTGARRHHDGVQLRARRAASMPSRRPAHDLVADPARPARRVLRRDRRLGGADPAPRGQWSSRPVAGRCALGHARRRAVHGARPRRVVVVRSEYRWRQQLPDLRPGDDRNPNESDMPGFGCANAYNTGQMLARPRDAAIGRPPGPADATSMPRRAAIPRRQVRALAPAGTRRHGRRSGAAAAPRGATN